LLSMDTAKVRFRYKDYRTATARRR
jgi:hypothetical protein